MAAVLAPPIHGCGSLSLQTDHSH